MEQTREPTDSTTQICPTDFDKGRIQWEEDFKQVVLEWLDIIGQKMGLNLNVTPYMKKLLKIDHRLKMQSYKIFRMKIWENSQNLKLEYPDLTPKPRSV